MNTSAAAPKAQSQNQSQTESPGQAENAGQAQTLARQLSRTIARLHRRGWCDGTGGNFSCVLQRHPLQLLMAPSGVDKGSVKPEQLIVVDGDAQVLRGAGKASAETRLHLEIVKRTGAGAVLHTHSQAATLLSRHCLIEAERLKQEAGLFLQGLEMLKGLAGITSHEQSVTIPVLANDQDIARLSDKAGPLLASAPWGLLIAGHGLYAWGADLREATRHLEIQEFLLEQHWRHVLLEALQRAASPLQPLSLTQPHQPESQDSAHPSTVKLP